MSAERFLDALPTGVSFFIIDSKKRGPGAYRVRVSIAGRFHSEHIVKASSRNAAKVKAYKKALRKP